MLLLAQPLTGLDSVARRSRPSRHACCSAVERGTLLDASPEPAASVSGRGVDGEEEELIRLVNVTKRFGKRKILAGVNLTIRRGEAVGIIGPSGTGKSTILRIMAGLLEPDSVRQRSPRFLSFPPRCA